MLDNFRRDFKIAALGSLIGICLGAISFAVYQEYRGPLSKLRSPVSISECIERGMAPTLANGGACLAIEDNRHLRLVSDSEIPDDDGLKKCLELGGAAAHKFGVCNMPEGYPRAIMAYSYILDLD